MKSEVGHLSPPPNTCGHVIDVINKDDAMDKSVMFSVLKDGGWGDEERGSSP